MMTSIGRLGLMTASLFAWSAASAYEFATEIPPGKVYVYKHSGGQPRQMEVYFPPGHDPKEDRVPGVLLFHGGAWKGGNLGQFRAACHYFASRGLVAATANYRMHDAKEVASLPAGESLKRVCITDARSALRWFKRNAKELGIDAERVITGGGSAGGHVSVLATLHEGLDDPSEATDIDLSVVAYLLFNPAFAPGDAADPAVDVHRFLKAEMAPAIVFFGTEDGSWKPGWDAVNDRLKALGNRTTEVLLASGEKHGFFNGSPWRESTLIAADRFLATHGLLQGDPTLKPTDRTAVLRSITAARGSDEPSRAATNRDSDAAGHGKALAVQLRSQRAAADDPGEFDYVWSDESWDPRRTAIIVCDVWDSHHCLNAVRRVKEFAPRLDAVLREARDRGATIIHAPSGCMEAYADHPARLRSQQVPIASKLPDEINAWCYQIPAEEAAVYPIDQTDGGEDDDPQEHANWEAELKALGRDPRRPWKRQYAAIGIDADQDFISDRGDEIWSLLEQRGIENVILTGVHTNMCVLGRPFGLRQLARNGKNVVLMRDMTDTMYNPQRYPYVSHFAGTDLIIDHIERFVSPTITSDQIIGGEPFRFEGDDRP